MYLLTILIYGMLFFCGACVLLVIFGTLAGWGEHVTERLREESRALWRPLTRHLPNGLHWSWSTIILVVGLPALVLAHTLGTMLTAWLR